MNRTVTLQQPKRATAPNIRTITMTALLSAMAYVLAFVEFPVPLSPSFARMDLSDFPALIGAFAFGPISGLLIHTYAGVELRLACAEMMERQGYPEPTGQAKITPAFNLPCKYVLHTVGPIIQGRVTKQDKELLASCYRSCLELAAENGLESMAFCCISTGEFHFPNELAAEIAVRVVKEFLQKQTSVRKVIFNVFKDLDKAIYEKLLRADGAAANCIAGL